MPTGSKSIRKISMNVSDLQSRCSSRGRRSPKVTSMSASTPQRNGSSDKLGLRMVRRSHMGEKTWERNTTGLATYTRQRKEQKHKQVEEAIVALLREHRAVNFNSVARAAGVTKAYLYSQPDLRERIEALRQQEIELAVRARVDRS